MSEKPSKSRPYSQPSTEIRDSTCPRSTAKFYLSVSHVIEVVRRAVTQPRRSGQLPVAAWRRCRDLFESLRLQAKKDSWKVTTSLLKHIFRVIHIKATSWSTIPYAHISATIQHIFTKISAVATYVKWRQSWKFQFICIWVTMLTKYIILSIRGKVMK